VRRAGLTAQSAAVHDPSGPSIHNMSEMSKERIPWPRSVGWVQRSGGKMVPDTLTRWQGSRPSFTSP